VLTLAAPCAAAALGALAVGVPPLESLGAFAAHHRAWDGGTFALPLAFGVVWPTATLCAAVTFGALAAAAKTKTKEGHGTVVGDRGGGVEESKKERWWDGGADGERWERERGAVVVRRLFVLCVVIVM
jgi:hypothetical protein